MRIVLIEQQPLLCEGFRTVIERTAGLLLVGQAAHAREAFRLIDVSKPEVVVLDLALPGMNGCAATREILRRQTGTRVLALSGACRERDVIEAFRAGVTGFVAATDPIAVLIEGIRAVAAGERYLSPSARALALPELFGGRFGAEGPPDALAALSSREREVFDFIVRGFRNREIARELCISVKTVETHRLHINRKLACSSSIELLRFALSNGVLAGGVDAWAADQGGGASVDSVH